MYESTDVFLPRGCNLDAVVAIVGEVLERRLDRSTNEWGVIYKAHPFGVWVTAHADCNLVDDAGIEFNRYDIQIRFEASVGTYDGQRRSELCRILALLTASRLSARLGCECLVVKDLQHLVERFPRPNP